jgi:hypothetical protein
MEDQKISINEEFEKATESSLISGNLKFSTDYVSRFQIYQALKKWIEADKAVLSAAIRSGGSSSIAVDFMYRMKDGSEEKSSQILHKVIRPFFKEALGCDAMNGWDYANSVIVIK